LNQTVLATFWRTVGKWQQLSMMIDILGVMHMQGPGSRTRAWAIIVVFGLAGTLADARLDGVPELLRVLRSVDGSVSCMVASTDDPQAGDRLPVYLRAPTAPAEAALQTLPPEQRDFSAVPVRVVLLPAPDASGAVGLQRLPVAYDPTLQLPPLDGAPPGVSFVRATFPRAWLVAGVTILGERVVKGPDNVRVASQTLCRITAADAAAWGRVQEH